MTNKTHDYATNSCFLNCHLIEYIYIYIYFFLFIPFSLSKLKDSRATALAFASFYTFKLHIVYFVWATELQSSFVLVSCLICTELFTWSVTSMWFPGVWGTSLLNTNHGIKRPLMEIKYKYFIVLPVISYHDARDLFLLQACCERSFCTAASSTAACGPSSLIWRPWGH